MAGTFILGETKVRPGTYFNIQKKGGNATAAGRSSVRMKKSVLDALITWKG